MSWDSDRSIEEEDLEESTVFLRPAEVLVRGVDRVGVEENQAVEDVPDDVD